MPIKALPAEVILKMPFPSYHRCLEEAKRLNRSGRDGDRPKAIALLDGPSREEGPPQQEGPPRQEGLRQRYPHVLAIGQELALALMECRRYDEAEAVLNDLEKTFMNLDEETLSRWGRLYKDRGDAYVRLPWSEPDGLPPDLDLAELFYRKSLAKYGQAYRIRSGHYPGINKATLLLILGSLRPPVPGAAPRPEVQESAELAGKLLADRPRWPREEPDDETVWHPATAGEAYLLSREWGLAEQSYREALRGPRLTARAREAMRRQVERIVMCFRNLGVAVGAPLDNPTTFFAEPRGPAPPPAPAPAPPDQAP